MKKTWEQVCPSINRLINKGKSRQEILSYVQKEGFDISNVSSLSSTLYRLRQQNLLNSKITSGTKTQTKRNEEAEKDRIWYKCFVVFSKNEGYNLSYDKIDKLTKAEAMELFKLTEEEATIIKDIAKNHKGKEKRKSNG